MVKGAILAISNQVLLMILLLGAKAGIWNWGIPGVRPNPIDKVLLHIGELSVLEYRL